LWFYFIATPALPYQAFVFGRFAAEKCTSLVVTSGTDARSPMWIFGRMAHKYPNILIHCVFSTKGREDLIPDEMLPRLWKYFAGIGRNHGIPVLAAGGVANHSHLLIALPVGVAPAKAIQVLKANSSRWIHEHGIAFAWQVGYGAFSVSSSNKTAVKDYIEHQAEHHRGRSYEAELEAMIRKSGMRFDPEEAFG
jgi:REP element-mobilizing transposase RayT